EKALNLDPKFGLAYFNLGNTHMALDHLDEAREAYEKSVENGIDFLSLHWNLYKIYHRQEKRQEAIKELNIILQIDPLNLDAQKKLKELAR
ncbi:MAG: tetratricopeptide repeat protein, partial [Nitrospinaceae bacterium]|nr:tetratricopeptide repeat protein [Nitrospinaceae bacterium]